MTSQRIERAKRVMRTIGFSKEPLDLVVDEDGSSPLIVAMPNEYVSGVFDRVTELGGSANIAVAYADHFQLLTLSSQAVTDGLLEVNSDLSMGMLCIKMTQNPGKTIRVLVREDAVAMPQAGSRLTYA